MSKEPGIPPPAHPHKRREALPWQQPKATEEDPEAMQRVKAILNSASYRRAENDSDFLARDDVRGVRLQIDYLKPELLLEEHEIDQAIVVLGARGFASQLPRCARWRRYAHHCRPTQVTWDWSVGWQLLSEYWPIVITTMWLASSGVSWVVRIMARAITIRSS
jgi:hypothetical protein